MRAARRTRVEAAAAKALKPMNRMPYKLNATAMAATDWAAPGSQPAATLVNEKDQLSTHFMAAEG